MAKKERYDLDLIDRRLLSLLQQDNQKSLDELADAVYSSRSVVQRRISRMRRSGIIRKEIAVVDPRLSGGYETFVICLSVNDERSGSLRAFCEKVDELPEIQQCYLTTGDANCVVVVLLKDAAALRTFVANHFTDDPFVRRFRSHLVTEGIKASLFVPVE